MSASETSLSAVTRLPVSIVPPWSRRSAASAEVIDADPPLATGQPQR